MFAGLLSADIHKVICQDEFRKTISQTQFGSWKYIMQLKKQLPLNKYGKCLVT